MAATTTQDDKRRLRAWTHAQRATLARESAGWLNYGAVRRALSGHCTVLLYLPTPFEPDLTPLLGMPGYRFAVTRTPETGHQLTLHELTHATALEGHRYGFLQPTADAPPIDPAGIDVAFVPGLAFDAYGWRLGHGAGWYDRLLPRLPAAAKRVGVTWDELVLDSVPVEPHDVRMTHLLTQSGFRAARADAGTAG